MKGIIIAFSFALLAVASFSQIQMKKWYLNGKEIDFTQSVPTIKSLPATFSGAKSAANGMYREDGELLFYVVDNTIYNKNGDIISHLPFFGPDKFGSEINIMPVPDQCGKYYIVYFQVVNQGHDHGSGKTTPDPLDPTIFQAVHLHYSIIDMSLNNGLGGLPSGMTSIPAGDEFQYNGIAGLAIGKLRSDNTRFIYGVGTQGANGKMQKYLLNSAGITQISSMEFSNSYSFFANAELDLSPDETKLAWANLNSGSTSNDVMIINLDGSGDHSNIQTINITSSNSALTGIEFSPDNSKLFIGISGVGISIIDLANNNSVTELSMSPFNAMGNSQLEIAYNGNLYAATSNNEIRGVNPNNLLLVPSINIGSAAIIQNEHVTYINYNATVLTLPDQVDGENYNDQFLNMPVACQCFLAGFSAITHTVSGTTPITWTSSSNPFGTSSIIKIDKGLTVPANTELTISGMTIEFGNNALITVNTGSTLNLINSTIKERDGCNDYFTLDVKQGGVVNVQNVGEIHLGPYSSISNKGTITIQSGGRIETHEYASFITQSGGKTTIENNAEITSHRGGEIVVEQGGILEYKNYTADKGIILGPFPAELSEPYLEIAGVLTVNPNTTFTFTGNGYIHWKTGNSTTFGNGSKITLNGSGKTDLLMKLENSATVNISASIDIQNGKIEYGSNSSFNGSNNTLFLKNLNFIGNSTSIGFYGDAITDFRLESSDFNNFYKGVFLENIPFATIASKFLSTTFTNCTTAIHLNNLLNHTIVSNNTITTCEMGIKGENADLVTLINLSGTNVHIGIDFTNTRRISAQNIELNSGILYGVMLNSVPGFFMSGGRIHDYYYGIDAINSQVFLRNGATIDENFSSGIHMVGSYDYIIGKFKAMVTIGDAGCGNIINNYGAAIEGTDFILNVDAIQHAINRSTPCKGCPPPLPYQVFPNRFYYNGNKIFQICYSDQTVAPPEILANGNFWGKVNNNDFSPSPNRFQIRTKYTQSGNCSMPIQVEACQFVDNASFYNVNLCTQWNSVAVCRKSSGGNPDGLVSGPPEFKECPALVHKPDIKTIHESFQEANVQFVPDDNIQTRSNFKEIADLKLSKNSAGEIIICDMNDQNCGNGGGGMSGEKISNPCAQLVMVAKVLYEPAPMAQRKANATELQSGFSNPENNPITMEHLPSIISLYPNPNDGTFTVAFLPPPEPGFLSSVKIYNILGELVFTSPISHPPSPTSTHLPQGMYFVKICSEENSFVKKLVIEK